jgi:hypothetical protein
MLTQVRTTSAPRPGFDNEVQGLSRSQRTAILWSIDQHSRSGEEDGQSRHCPPGFSRRRIHGKRVRLRQFRKEIGRH